MKLDFTSDINRGYESGLEYPRIDKFIILVHWWSFGLITLLTFANSVLRLAEHYQQPFSWRVISMPEAIWATAIIFFAALLPTLLIGKFKNHYYWRLLVTFTLSIFAYVAVFVGGGSIEMHFLFFSMIALVAIYADWRLGWFMLVLVGLHHTILNYLAPTWVYYYGRNDLAVIAHAIPVIVTIIFTTVLCNIHRKTIQQIEVLREELRDINKDIEEGRKA